MRSPVASADLDVHLEPAEAELRKNERRRRLNVVAYPRTRLLGNLVLLGGVYLHNHYLLGDFSAAGYATLAAGLLGYSLVSWLVLWLAYSPTSRIDLGDVFMTLDIVAWTFVIYASGGERSWLVLTMMIRAADQRLAGPRRVLRFGAVSVLSYAGLLAYLALGEGRALSWPGEITKLLLLAGANAYLALTARTAQAVRVRLVETIRVAREALATRGESDERYRALFETVNDPILTTDLRGTITAVNRALEAATGYRRDELIGQHFALLTTPAVAEASRERVRRLMDGEAVAPAEVIGIHKDGERVPYEVRTALLRDASGLPVGLVAIYRDIRERKRVEDALSRARDAAVRANRAKSQFLASMSHELRTPLNSILGFSRILMKQREGPLNERQVAFVESMVLSATHLLEVISSVLDLSRIEAGKAEVSLESVDPLAVVRETVESCRPLAVAKGLTLTVDVPASMPPIRVDPTKVRQILLNLLSNAVKFTSRGDVSVTAAVRPDAIELVVRDTGPGVPAADLPRLFEPFQDSALGREAGGAGLGLAISKSFVELHGGTIWVETADRQGSAFHVTFPLASA